jgi:hypothetical protein
MSTIEETISAMVPRLTEDIAGALREKLRASMEYDLSRRVMEEASKYINEHILPDVRDHLVAHEAEIKASMIAAIRLAVDAIGAAMVEHTKKRLTEYGGDKLLGTMLAPLFRAY